MLRAEVDSLKAQLAETRRPTSRVSNNTRHGSVRSAVLSDGKQEVGFKKNAWGPPSEDDSEDTDKQPEKPTPVGFNKTAWAPPDVDTEE